MTGPSEPRQPSDPRAPSDSPKPSDAHRPSETDGYRILSYMLGGMLLYGGIGWLIGRWTGLPILFPIGMIAGIAGSVALIIFRVTRS